MKTTARHALRIFLTGVLAALPLAATVLIFVWGARVLYAWLGPGSFVGGLLIALGLGGTGSEVVGYLLGLGIVVLAIFALGLLVQTRLRGGLARAFNNVMQRIPLVRNVYDLIRKFVDLVAQRDASGARSMSPVWLRFGGQDGAMVLGLLSSPEPVMVGGHTYLAVLVPTAPLPVGGGLIFVPADWVTPAELGMEALTSIYVSMGVTAHQHLGRPPG
jgi:uncharacterized membrane protein